MKNVLNKINCYFFTVVVVLAPILQMYGINLSTITLFDLLTTISFSVFIFEILFNRNNIKIKVYEEIIPFAILIFISSLFIIKDKHSVLRTVRYFYYLYISIFVAPTCFDFSFCKKFLKWFGVCATSYLFLQIICVKFFSFYPTGYLHFLPLLEKNVEVMEANAVTSINARASSFFIEPAHYAQFTSICLFSVVFSKKLKWIDIVIALYFFAGLLLSKSSTGIVIGCLVFFLYFLSFAIKSQKRKYVFAFLSITILMGCLAFVFYEKILLLFPKLGSLSSFMNRFEGYNFVFDNLTPLNIIFGHGMVEPDVYLTGIARLVYYLGIVGTTLFIFALKPNRKNWAFLLVLIVLNIGTTSLFSNMIVLFLSINYNLIESDSLIKNE